MEPKKLGIYLVLSFFLSIAIGVNAEQTPDTQLQMQTRTQMQSQLMNMQVKKVKGMKVVNALGEELGRVRMISQNRMDNSVNAIVGVGGFLGIGAKKIPVPVDQLQLKDDELIWNSSINKDQFSQQPEYLQTQASEVNENRKLAEVFGTVIPGMERAMTFQELDIDNSGFLTPNEIQTDPKLSIKWKKVDKNNDDQIDRSEFSAFETNQPEEMHEQSEIQ